ncbi:MAG: hypothetical protein IKV54_01285, partial [Clostridia bacterium]|nr:hypothetical protein [Clostridia bacterium]
MKKIIAVLFLATIALLVFTGCSGKVSDILEGTESSNDISGVVPDKTNPSDGKVFMIDGTEYVFSSSDSEVHRRASKDSFAEAIEFTANGQKITVEPPVFTGLSVDMCYTYNDFFPCIDGSVIFTLSGEDKNIYLQMDKNGRVITVSDDYGTLSEGRSVKRYLPEISGADAQTEGRVIGDEVTVRQIGEFGNYTQYLYSAEGDRISDGYDSIGYFYDGLALITKDNKIGLIDESGNEVL